MLLKQSTARNFMVLMIDAADHLSGKTGLTLTITASKDGAAFASITPTVTERGNGWYNLALDTTMTNTLGALALHITGTGADPTDEIAQVVVELPGVSIAATSVTGAVASVTGAVGSVTGNVGGNVTGSVGSVLGAFTIAQLEATWDSLVGDHAGASSFGQRMSRIPNVAPSGNGGLPTVNASNYIAGIAGTINTLDGIPAAVWAVLTATLTVASTIGKLLVDNLNATVSSRLASASYTAPDNAGITAINAKTTNLPASPAAVGSAMTLTSGERDAGADALLARNVAGGSSTGRTVKEAFYRLRNRVRIAAGTATVYAADDTTPAWTAAVTTTAGNPVSEVDPS